jgi:hypothetical protein
VGNFRTVFLEQLNVTITRSGASQAYSENWARAFGGKSSKTATLTKPEKRSNLKKKVGKSKKGKK